MENGVILGKLVGIVEVTVNKLELDLADEFVVTFFHSLKVFIAIAADEACGC